MTFRNCHHSPPVGTFYATLQGQQGAHTYQCDDESPFVNVTNITSPPMGNETAENETTTNETAEGEGTAGNGTTASSAAAGGYASILS